MEPTTLDRLNAVRQTKNFQCRVNEEERQEKISQEALRKYAGIFETKYLNTVHFSEYIMICLFNLLY